MPTETVARRSRAKKSDVSPRSSKHGRLKQEDFVCGESDFGGRPSPIGLFVSTLLLLLASVLFGFGFFYGEQQHAVGLDGPDVCPSRELNTSDRKLVFILVDAFGFSFLHEYPNAFPFLRGRVQGGDPLFRAKVQTPTVTMPRVKAIVSGAVPNFIDVVGNLNADKFNGHNWVTLAHQKGYRLKFAGDDTWTRMFPNLFEEVVQLDSFYIKDFVVVDQKVAEFADRIAQTNDWDLLILHFLGLDHIGHSLGGQHELIPSKLREMDSVLEKIYTHLTKKDVRFDLIVFGDHGMTLAGGHGGADSRETNVPVIVLNQNKSNVNSWDEPVEEIQQVDLAATVSNLLGLCLPRNSLGVTFVNYLNVDEDVVKDSLLQNAKHLGNLLSGDRDMSDLRQHCQLLPNFTECRRLLKELQSEALNKSRAPGTYFFLVGCCSIAMVTLVLYKTINSKLSFLNVVYLLPVLYFGSSLVEEEHDLWFFVVPSLVVIHWMERGLDCFDKSLSLVVLLWRFLRFPYEHSRRRWSTLGYQSIIPVDSLLPWYGSSFVIIVYSLIRRSTYRQAVGFTRFNALRFSIITLLSCFSCLSYNVVLNWESNKTVTLENILTTKQLILSVTLGLLIAGQLSKAFIIMLSCIFNIKDIFMMLLLRLLGDMLRGQSDVLLLAIIQSSLFVAGGSNSLNTIDLAVGYAGLESYVPGVVGVQIALKVYMGPINLMIGRFAPQSCSASLLSSMLCLRSTALFCSALVMFWHFHHLFVWSVFAPKLLYEIAHSLAFALFVLSSLVKTHCLT